MSKDIRDNLHTFMIYAFVFMFGIAGERLGWWDAVIRAITIR